MSYHREGELSDSIHLNEGETIMHRLIILLAAASAMLLASHATAQLPFGAVTSHNGSVTSNPPGTGDVPVSLNYPYHEAVYSAVATHEVHYSYALSVSTHLYNPSIITNDTGQPWIGFEILLDGGDFAGWKADIPIQAPADQPIVDSGRMGFVSYDSIPYDLISLEHGLDTLYLPFTFAGSTITRFNDQGAGFRDARLTVTFGDPLQPTTTFRLVYSIIPSPGLPNATELTAFFTPIVPEPGTLTLLAAGVLATVPRRKPM
jgi:hypothetical protein